MNTRINSNNIIKEKFKSKLDTCNTINLIAQIADMKEIDYTNTLAITGLMELLIDKNILTKDEISKKVNSLNKYAFDEQVK